MSKARTIGKNITFIAASRIVAVVMSFVLFPFIISHVGKEVYGVYLIVMSVTGYFGIFDLGVMSALTKYVSEYNGKGDREGINKIANASFSFYVMIGIIVSLILFLCSVYFNKFFKVEPLNIVIIKQLFISAGIFAFFIWPLSMFRGAIQGLNLWNVDASVNMVSQILIAAATFFLLISGHGIVALFIATQMIIIGSNFFLYLIVKKKIGLKIIFPYTDIHTFKFIFNFSTFMFLSSLITILLFQIHNIIIGYFVSVSAVSVYAVAYNIQNYFRVANSTIGSPSWIIASEMEGARDYEKQKSLLLKGTKYMTAFFLPAVIIAFFFLEPFINYWMGPSFSYSILPAKIIVLFWLFSGTSELAAGMLTAKGIIRQPLMIQAAAAISNIIISLCLIKMLGIVAIAIGLTFSMAFILFPLYIRLSLKSLGVTIKEYFDKSIKCNLGLYLLVAIMSIIVMTGLYPKNLFVTFLEMGLIYSLSLLFYYIMVLSSNERLEIRKMAGLEAAYNKLVSAKEWFR